MKSPAPVYDTFESPLGIIYLIFSGTGLTGISFRKPKGVPRRKGCAPRGFVKEMKEYFAGSNHSFSQEVRLFSGTEFERRVWEVLRRIPYGETRTYRWVAKEVGHPGAARAVGRALSKNPVPIVLPCHRVIESDGSLGGYSSGKNRKVRLLDLEYYALQNSREQGARDMTASGP